MSNQVETIIGHDDEATVPVAVTGGGSASLLTVTGSAGGTDQKSTIIWPPRPRARSLAMPSLPGRMRGIWRLGNSQGMACVLKSARVLIFGPPSTTATSTPARAR